jgi:predicted CXXCH cytochrome family protein
MFKNFFTAFSLLCLTVLPVMGCSQKFLKSDAITVFFSNDIRGEFENCGCADVQLGGLARKAHLLRLQAKKSPDILRLDAGNLFFSKQPANAVEAREFLLKAGYIISAYNAMGCDALNVSEGDLLLGMPAIRELRSKAAFPFISSNILRRDSGMPVFEPEIIKAVGKTRVAVLGVCPQDGVFMPELRIEDPVTTIRNMAEKLRGRSDFLIVLSGLGLERDRELARQVSGIGLIISGRADRLLDHAVAENGATIVQAFNRGQYVGKVDVERAGEKFSVSSRLIALDPGIGEEKNIVTMGNAYKAQVTAMNKQAFFKGTQQSAPNSRGGYAGADSCVQCHGPQYEAWCTTPHARAYQTLVDKKAQYQAECLVCHTTAYGEPGGYDPEQKELSAMINVQCEACHGPAAGHKGAQDVLVRNGDRQVCMGCHTEKNSPKFDYDEYLPLVKCLPGGTKH